ncbi:Hypothetical protein R9X50_00136900 [Acrodontium crateriforme]|uniref:GRIP domain-containing protein n=1 Tax=Acrodontium crateriforme TaxID=150365 RepID=A0AAQ3LZM1_9PEZI|nr:Hypothetical protein R9X50_00136900 [Acrodontium crateriforme]
MSAVNSAADAASKSASKKKKKNNKKKANGNTQSSAEAAEVNGSKEGLDDEDDEDDSVTTSRRLSLLSNNHNEGAPGDQSSADQAPNGSRQVANEEPKATSSELEATAEGQKPSNTDATSRLDAMQEERNNLRDEVAELRRSLESLQAQHTEELNTVKEELEECQQGKEDAEEQYRNLLGKVNTIRSQLGDRLKADAEELEHARRKIEQLETINTESTEENKRLQEEISKMNSQMEEQKSEVDSLRSRTNLSTSNWAKERDDLVSREAYLREEYDVAKQAMQDWEILATEERSRRETLEERVADLEEQLIGSKEAYERARGEVETQGTTVDGLQRALRDVQEERKRELRELVEQSQAQLEQLRTQKTEAESTTADLKQQLERSQAEVERALPFEKEVREKNLLIGKLRHEAVILNDHLTKALRFLKRGKPEDNVDRQLVTNHFLHFLALDRSDPKKFQVLQLIAALLGWDDTQKEQAGIIRTGAGSLKLPMSPFRRTPSTPGLSSTFVPESPIGKESLAELWSDFLERESEATGGSSGSRKGSLAKTVRSPSLVSAPALVSPLSGMTNTKDPLSSIGSEILRSETQSPGASSVRSTATLR